MSLKDTIKSIRSKIESAQKRGGFSHPVQLIAVTKTHPFSLIQECYDAGITAIGENKIQEASQKFESFENMQDITRRFIGHLQSNKVKKCLKMFDTIDSVDSLKLAKRISNAALSLKKTVPVLLEINTSGEVQKHGFLPNQLDEIIECFNETNIKIEGLMTVGPKTTEEKKTRDSFIQLRKTRDSISQLLNQPNLRELSMGMSGDYEIAVEEGSSVVRLGTALFGNRRTPDTPK
jgi:pyridoxal phosphate enzyme (YggS family)